MKKCQPFVVLILVLASGTAVGQEGADVDVARLDPDRPTVLITGSNRGIGLGFAAGYAAEGWNVIATARNPDDALELAELAYQFDSVFIEELDVTDERELEFLSAKYSGIPIDVLINNAAFHGGAPEDHWLGSYDYEVFERYMQVNVFGPLAVAEAFFESTALSDQKKIVTLTAGGWFSVMQNLPPGRGASFQAISKTAVNMAMITLRNEVKDQGIIVALISPGVVMTDGARAMMEIMQAATGPEEAGTTEEISGSVPPPLLSVEESVAAMMEVIEALDESHDGSKLDHEGNVLPW